ncbi:MAG: sugar ABC transporter permease, partial [Nitrosospira sp.]|nr:sugar ABC transporter permease [Nitrosospira sp.]
MRRREAIDAYVFMMPAILGMIIFVLGPMVVSLYLSFTEYDLLGAGEWIG